CGAGWLALAREVASYPGGPLPGSVAAGAARLPEGMAAIHRFLRLDGDFRIEAMSAPFAFTGIGNECCGGLIVRDDRALIAWSREQREIWTGSLPLVEIDALLQPVEALLPAPEVAAPA
ncbi:MAG: hypothetical protein ACR2J8_12910, partial [Thermomicrobiales bacterium]